MKKIICGIQEVGVGVANSDEIWKWYRQNFGVDIKIFEETSSASLMKKYTGGKIEKRRVILAMSMEGGGGIEVWQYADRVPIAPKNPIQLGDYGIFACRIKSRDINASYEFLKNNNAILLGGIKQTSLGESHFFVKDLNGNIFNIVQEKTVFQKTKFKGKTGGVAGAMLGVSNINKSIKLYSDILGYSTVEYDETGVFECFSDLPGGNKSVRRVLLSHPEVRKGPFAPLLGPTKIELIQATKQEGISPIFKGRQWGDLGFIHLCFDVRNMDVLKLECEKAGFAFQVDSGNALNVDDAGGRLTFIEDNDGTLIEFVETHKVPILKNIGWYIDLRNKDPEKSLPRFLLKAMGMSRVK